MAKMDTIFEGSVTDSLSDAISGNGEPMYRVWACDNQVYGPIPESVLKQWVIETRVQRETWVYLEDKMEWRPAVKIEGLHYCFPAGEETTFLHQQSLTSTGIDAFELRQFPIFAGLTNQELAQFIRLSELHVTQPGEV